MLKTAISNIAGLASTAIDALAGFVRTSTEQTGLFGQALPTSVHTHETSLTTPPGAGDGDTDERMFALYTYGTAEQRKRADDKWREAKRFTSAFAYERAGFAGSPATAGETNRRHAWWSEERTLVRAAMESAGLPAARLERFDACGAASFILVQTAPPWKFKRACNKCRDRHCKACSIERANLYASNIKARLNQYAGRLNRRFRFVTLTLKSSDQPLPDQFRRFMKAFAALRRIKLCNLRKRKLRHWWSTYVVGGCYFLESTLSKGQWHVHAHLLIEGAFLPHAELKALWHHATGDSDIVDVRELSGVDDVAAELSKYAAKGASNLVINRQDKMIEWMIGTKSLRFCSTFGTWRGFKLSKSADEWKPGEWKNLGREDDIRAKAALRDPWALRVVSALEQDTDARKKNRPPPAKITSRCHGPALFEPS